MSVCYLNGRWQPLEEARVSPMDRGFLFGDGAYEVVPAYSGRPFRLDEHLSRLQRTLDAIELPNPHALDTWRELVREAIARNPWPDQSIYIQITRGQDAVRNHVYPREVHPTVFLLSEPLTPPDEALREAGGTAVSAADFRWLRCDLKSISVLANCLLRNVAVRAGATETVMFRDGFLTEGSASNIFIVRDGVLLAPPKSHLMLPGITYDVVLELAELHGLPCTVREILEDEVRAADELWMSSSTKEVLSIVRLDERPVGDGRPGPVGRQMYRWYQEFKNTVMRSE